jgi:hypothetical protein
METDESLPSVTNMSTDDDDDSNVRDAAILRTINFNFEEQEQPSDEQNHTLRSRVVRLDPEQIRSVPSDPIIQFGTIPAIPVVPVSIQINPVDAFDQDEATETLGSVLTSHENEFGFEMKDDMDEDINSNDGNMEDEDADVTSNWDDVDIDNLTYLT